MPHRRTSSRAVESLKAVRVSGWSSFDEPAPSPDTPRTSRAEAAKQASRDASASQSQPSQAPDVTTTQQHESPPEQTPTPQPQNQNPIPQLEDITLQPNARTKQRKEANRTPPEMNNPNMAPEEREIVHNKIINEEYKIWKKNSVFLYDIMYSRALDWPTLTTQWLPDVKTTPGKTSRQHRLLIGTHTSNQQQEYLQIAHINLPPPPSMSMADYNENTKELGGHGSAKEPIVFSVVQKIPHPGEVNKARYQPQNPNIIATWSPDGNVYVWDRSKHSSVPGLEIKPQATLKGHKAEGFAVEWNPFKEGQLISGSEDKTVNLWEVARDFSRDNPIVSPANTFTHHSAVVNDVQYHPQHGLHIFGSVSDDLSICIMDQRSSSTDRPSLHFKNAHKDAINSLSFHPKHDKLLATGSADKTIGIFDLRFPEHGKIHSLEGHKDTITKVDWHPMDSSIIASSSNDRRIIFWDLSKGGAEQTPEDAEDGPPEMLFMHGGHTNSISDFSWNRNDPWVMCSTGEDNLVQVWRASRQLVETMPASVHRREVSAS